MNTEQRIVLIVAEDPEGGLTGAEIWRALGWRRWFVQLYPALMRLEQRGRLVSAWDDGPYPRSRRYFLNQQQGKTT